MKLYQVVMVDAAYERFSWYVLTSTFNEALAAAEAKKEDFLATDPDDHISVVELKLIATENVNLILTKEAPDAAL